MSRRKEANAFQDAIQNLAAAVREALETGSDLSDPEQAERLQATFDEYCRIVEKIAGVR